MSKWLASVKQLDTRESAAYTELTKGKAGKGSPLAVFVRFLFHHSLGIIQALAGRSVRRECHLFIDQLKNLLKVCIGH